MDAGPCWADLGKRMISQVIDRGRRQALCPDIGALRVFARSKSACAAARSDPYISAAFPAMKWLR